MKIQKLGKTEIMQPLSNHLESFDIPDKHPEGLLKFRKWFQYINHSLNRVRLNLRNESSRNKSECSLKNTLEKSFENLQSVIFKNLLLAFW